MENDLKKFISELICVSGVVILAAVTGLGAIALNIWCHHHGYLPDYRRFEECGKHLSKDVIELKMPEWGTAYIVNGVWVEGAGRLVRF